MYHNHLLCIIHTSNTIMKMSIYTNIKHRTTRKTSYTWFTPSTRLCPPKLVSLYIILSRENLQLRGIPTTNLFHREYSPITISFLVRFSFSYILNIQKLFKGMDNRNPMLIYSQYTKTIQLSKT